MRLLLQFLKQILTNFPKGMYSVKTKGTTHSTMMIKFMQNSVMLDITNNGLDAIIFGPEVVLGITDLRF